ncbi:hypothetical protein PHLGIDRAFT_124517 [Phlebiopsis gigantea 11061_1 CR5-6]|uniref:F-box domain-containing protein n=1 Tax=Phlebiopsis gigantea (strain 11061_1 CR5-6) TaxID=745531 RepID=A0A0C3SFC4_PHLG1|nr:hypothetical protein PHLGIDRAFT_124517 [Phlebiopsis gigantea 11061_1 CR5-6]
MSQLTPVYTLPEDVVTGIFKTAYEHHFPHCRLDDGMPHTHSPVAVSHVSRRWRGYALSVPTIWTCIHVTPGQHSRYAEVIKAYLIRSRELPISIFFLCHTIRDRQSWYPWDAFRRIYWLRYKSCWKYLLAERHRWKNCAVYLGHQRSLTLLLQSIEGKAFPRLEYFGLSPRILPAITNKTLPDFNTPQLMHLRIDSLPGITGSPLKVFTHLTQLNISGAYSGVGIFLKMLRQASATLQSLTVGRTTFSSGDDLALPSELTLTLPQLTHLTLSGIAYDTETIPNMTVVLCRAATFLCDLSLGESADTPDSLAFEGLFLPTVRKLKSEMLPPRTRESILAFPGLVTLQAPNNCTEILARAIELDTEVGTGCTAWPELKTVVVEDVEEAELVDFVEHRAHVQHPLRTLVMKDSSLSKLSAQTMTILQKLKLNVLRRSDASAALQIDDGWTSAYWDPAYDKPILVPWENSTAFYDQFRATEEEGEFKLEADYSEESEEGEE